MNENLLSGKTQTKFTALYRLFKHRSAADHHGTRRSAGAPRSRHTQPLGYCNRTLKLFAMITLLTLWGVADVFAGQGYYITVKSNDNATLNVMVTSSNCWHRNQMADAFTVQPGMTSDAKYTEAQAGGVASCNEKGRVLTFVITRVGCPPPLNTFTFQLENNGGFDAGITQAWDLSNNNQIGIMLSPGAKASEFGISVTYQGSAGGQDRVLIEVGCNPTS